MPPKKKFTKEQIVDAAFEIAKQEGIDSITIRKVATKLGSSIAPIYVNFNDADELVREVIHKTVELSNHILQENHTGNPFHDMGVASLRFARDYSVLFRDLVWNPNKYVHEYEQEMNPVLLDQMKEDADLQGFSDDELRLILLKMRACTLGLSIMVANGMLPEDVDEKAVIQIMDSMAEDVVMTARLRKNEGLDERIDGE